MSVTFEVTKPETSSEESPLLQNMLCMSATFEVSHPETSSVVSE